MTQPISSALVARAASSYQKPAGHKPSASAVVDRSFAPLLDRASGPAFVIELSSAAKQHVGGRGGDVLRNHTQKVTGGQAARIAEDEFLVDGVQGASLDTTIEADGRGRREAPLSKPDGAVVYKPPGSIIDVRV